LSGGILAHLDAYHAGPPLPLRHASTSDAQAIEFHSTLDHAFWGFGHIHSNGGNDAETRA